VTIVTCGDVEANRAQVERCMAWVYVKYNKDGSLAAVEAKARTAKRGLWAEREPVAPWEFRHPAVASAADADGPHLAEGWAVSDGGWTEAVWVLSIMYIRALSCQAEIYGL
jgi:hypothetical protein